MRSHKLTKRSIPTLGLFKKDKRNSQSSFFTDSEAVENAEPPKRKEPTFCPQPSSLDTLAISRKVTDSNTPELYSVSCSSSELLSDIMLPSPVEPSPLCLEIEEGNLETSRFKVILYIVRCFYDRQQIQLFFNSDQFIDPKISNEEKNVFFQIVLAQLTPEQAKILNHRGCIEKKLACCDVSELYLEALIAGKEDLIAPFSDETLSHIKANYLLQSLCDSYLFFEFVFSANPERKINDRIFTLFEYFNIRNAQAGVLYAHILRFLYGQKEIYVLSLESMYVLVHLLSEWLAIPEEIDNLLNALVSTHKGHRILRAMNNLNASKFLDFLKKNEKTEIFFSKMSDVFELTAVIMNPSKVESCKTKQKLAIFATEEVTYFINSLPSSNLIEKLLIQSSKKEWMQFLDIVWELNLAATDTLIFKKMGFVYCLKDMGKEEELVQRIKRWFSFATLTDSPEIQRAFMSDEGLIKGNQVKLQTYQSVLISVKQAKIIQNLRQAISLNELKFKWLPYFKAIWVLLLEHWDPRAYFFDVTRLRDSFKKVMLDKLERYEPNAHNPELYRLSELPKEMTAEILQNSALIQEYQSYLDKMTICYEEMTVQRKQNEAVAADLFPEIEGYISFQTLLILSTPSLSREQGFILSIKFIQLFVQMLSDRNLSNGWSEKIHHESPQMLYVNIDLSQSCIKILRDCKMIKLSKVPFNTECYLKEKLAKEAISQIYEEIDKTIDSIERVSKAPRDFKGYDLSYDEEMNSNSPLSFFSSAHRSGICSDYEQSGGSNPNDEISRSKLSQ